MNKELYRLRLERGREILAGLDDSKRAYIRRLLIEVHHTYGYQNAQGLGIMVNNIEGLTPFTAGGRSRDISIDKDWEDVLVYLLLVEPEQSKGFVGAFFKWLWSGMRSSTNHA